MHPKHIKEIAKRTLKDNFLQHWYGLLETSSKSLTYQIFKTELKLEPYLINLSQKSKVCFTKFRTSNHRLPIETGRWNNIERNDRICPKCNSGDVGDEYHYIFKCAHFEDVRKKYIHEKYWNYPSINKMKILFNSTDITQIGKLCSFIRIIMNSFN